VSRRRHLTAATAAPTVVGVGFAALATLTGNAWFVLLAGACAGLVIASLASRHRLDDLTICLTGPTRLAVGETGTHRLHVHNRGQVSSAPVTLTQEIRGLPVESTTIRLESSAPLGLLATVRQAVYAHRLIVHPPPVPPDLSIAARGPDEDSVHPVPGVGLDLAGIREWRSGDDPRRVHWRSTARRGRIVIAERGTGPAPALRVVVVGPSEAPDWEPLVAIAAASTRAAQLDRRAVAVTAWTPQGPSPVANGSPVDLLDWWAALESAVLPAPADLVVTRGGHPAAGSLVVVASGHVTPAWWEQVRTCAAGSGLEVSRVSA
jgi:uncharacterized protein DUF58